MNQKQKNLLTFVSKSYQKIGIFLLVLAALSYSVYRFPHIWYTLYVKATEKEVETLTSNLDTEVKNYENQTDNKPDDGLPPIDPNLPLENYIRIPKIKMEGQIFEGKNYEEALANGVWRVDDFGTPLDGKTIILAAHRFGYITWTDQERLTKSFYYLPNTKIGDKIEIIWGQRVFQYEIYKTDESTKIYDFDADLILYTCKLYNSPIRIFRYAKRIN